MVLSIIMRRLPIAIMLALALVLALPLAAFVPTGVSALAATHETLTAPFVNGPNGATTANSYSGSVSLTISGFGQAAATAYSDAFYVFTNNSGNPITPEHHFDFGLCINSQPVENYLTTIPPYSSSHTYQFTIPLGSSPQHITFGVCDGFTVDNSGSYTITVTATKENPLNLIVLVHGCCTDKKGVKEWEDLGKAIDKKIKDKKDWKLMVWDWHEDTPTHNYSTCPLCFPIDALAAYNNAELQAADLAAAISPYPYTYIHMIGHSAGARLIDTAAKNLVALYNNVLSIQDRPFIHLTFLDAFRPFFDDYGNLENYPEHYSEHYVDVNLIAASTNDYLPHTFNFDITNWQDQKDDRRDEFGHQWPRRWYTRSVETPNRTGVLGFELSLEGGNEAFCTLAQQFPPGASCQLTNLASEVLCGNFVFPTLCQ